MPILLWKSNKLKKEKQIMSKKVEEKESEKYQVMLQEVQAIVTDISSQELDLNQMISKVERGYEVIKKMRHRLNETKEKVEKLRLEYNS